MDYAATAAPSARTTDPTSSTTATAGFWNGTAPRTYFYDALSVLLPAGEQFVIDAVADGARRLAPASDLRRECDRFVAEESTHQRAHRLYNDRLKAQGYDIAPAEAQLSRDLAQWSTRLTLNQRLCLAAALEHITAGLSDVSLRSQRWLTHDQSREARLWQWHCAEELGHASVATDLLYALDVPYRLRVTWLLLAGLWMAMDVGRLMRLFYRTDVARGRVRAWGFWRDMGMHCLRVAGDVARLAGHTLRYFLPLPRPLEISAPVANREATVAPAIVARPLRQSDVPALLALEQRCWTPEQRASEMQLRARIALHPDLSLGAFCPQTGAALASLFMKPASPQAMERATTWGECVNKSGQAGHPTRALFGISLSSTHTGAVDALMQYFWPRALHAGWRDIYLGSPVPGLSRWRQAHPDAPVEAYAHAQRRGLPLDPQLRYYHQRGFRHIVSVRPGYFPHQRSLDYGVLLRGAIPGARWSALWRLIPLRVLDRFSALLFRVL